MCSTTPYGRTPSLTSFRSHNLRFGYEGFWGDNLTFFRSSEPQPSFTLFRTVSDFGSGQDLHRVRSLIRSAHRTAGRPARRQLPVRWQHDWSVRTRHPETAKTLTYGLRWDDFGNPSPQKGTISSNFFYGPGQSITDQAANGYVKQVSNVFNHSIMAASRVGLAWDLTGQEADGSRRLRSLS